MVICPRCEQPVDETTRTTCPLCFTPIAAPGNAAPTAPPPQAGGAMPPQQYAPQPGGVMPLAPPDAMPPAAAPNSMPTIRPMPAAPVNIPAAAPRMEANQRMTLGGEIIQAPEPMSSKPPPGNSQYQARASAGTPRQPAQVERAKPNFGAIALVVVLLGGGGGGWYFWMHRTNPKEQAQKFFDAMKTINSKAMYQTVETDKSEEDFVKDGESSLQAPGAKDIVSAIMSNIQFKAGEPKYKGMSEATVPIAISGSVALPFPGQAPQEISKTIDLPMKNFNGIWKVPKDSVYAGGSTGLLSKLKGSR